MKPFPKRYWPLITLALLLASVAVYLTRVGMGFLHKPILGGGFDGEGLRLKDIQYTHSDPDRRVKWSLDAKEVSLSADKQSIVFAQFSLRIEPEGRPAVRVTGSQGDYSRNNGEIHLRGDLEAHSENGYSLVTEHLLFNEKEGWLSTEEAVRIQAPHFTVDGKGLWVDLEKRKLRIASDVTTRVERGAVL
jgi:LPS export ABC transporter protein LptC